MLVLQSQILDLEYILLKLLRISNATLATSKVFAHESKLPSSPELQKRLDEAYISFDEAVDRIEDLFRGRRQPR